MVKWDQDITEGQSFTVVEINALESRIFQQVHFATPGVAFGEVAGKFLDQPLRIRMLHNGRTIFEGSVMELCLQRLAFAGLVPKQETAPDVIRNAGETRLTCED